MLFQTYIGGKSIVIHAGEDDLGLGGDMESLNTGNAGARRACGIIEVSPNIHFGFPTSPIKPFTYSAPQHSAASGYVYSSPNQAIPHSSGFYHYPAPLMHFIV